MSFTIVNTFYVAASMAISPNHLKHKLKALSVSFAGVPDQLLLGILILAVKSTSLMLVLLRLLLVFLTLLAVLPPGKL